MTREEILQIARKAGSLIEAAQEKDLLWLERYTKMAIAHVDGNDTFCGCVDKVEEKRHEPLTDEEILNLARNHYNPHQRAEISFARAIEAAHGIKD